MATKFRSNFEYQSLFPLLANIGDMPTLFAALRKIAGEAVELLGLADCAVALLDAHGDYLLIVATSQAIWGEGLSETTPFSLKASPLARIVTERVPLLVSDAHLDAWLPGLGMTSTCTLACLPLLDHDQLQGVLLASSAASDAFGPQQMPLLRLLADQAVLVINQARLSEQARVAEHAKAHFLSLLTHELRSPLNSINGYLDLLLDGLGGELSTQQQEFLRRARAGSEHLYAMLEDLLLIARADASQLRLKREPVVLQDLVSDVFEGLELVAEDAEVTLETRIPSDLPALLADTVRLQQVIRNLLNNAVRFTPAGGRVTLAARLLPVLDGKPELVEISVRDTGYGILPENQERIFERFFQIPPQGGRISGLGLGLTAAQKIIELHGGSIRVESVPGEGSIFSFTLPPARFSDAF
jgi:signal transduction histidine kinase